MVGKKLIMTSLIVIILILSLSRKAQTSPKHKKNRMVSTGADASATTKRWDKRKVGTAPFWKKYPHWETGERVSENVGMRLVEPYVGKGKNATLCVTCAPSPASRSPGCSLWWTPARRVQLVQLSDRLHDDEFLARLHYLDDVSYRLNDLTLSNYIQCAGQNWGYN